MKINDVFKPGTLVTGKQLKEAGFSKFYKIMCDDDVHGDMHYKEGENTDVLPFNPTGNCREGGLYFSTVDEIFAFVNYGDYIREVTVSDDEPVYIEDSKMKAHTICLGKRMPLWTVKTFSKLINEGTDIHIDGDCVLCRVAERGCLEIIKFLTSIGTNVRACGGAICGAAEYGYLETAQFLVSVGADVHTWNDYALREAASNGHLEVVRFLISVGANIHVFNSEALRRATYYNHIEVAKYLISVGADVSVLTEAQKRKLGI